MRRAEIRDILPVSGQSSEPRAPESSILLRPVENGQHRANDRTRQTMGGAIGVPGPRSRETLDGPNEAKRKGSW